MFLLSILEVLLRLPYTVTRKNIVATSIISLGIGYPTQRSLVVLVVHWPDP